MQKSSTLAHNLTLISFSDYKFILYTYEIYSIKLVRLEVIVIGKQAFESCRNSMFNGKTKAAFRKSHRKK